MSKNLIELEERAALMRITDRGDIGQIMEYLLSLPFTHFRSDEKRYRYIMDSICDGFNLRWNSLLGITLADVMLFFGYMPGVSLFEPPDDVGDKGDAIGKKRYNMSSCSCTLAMILLNAARKDVRIREFKYIGLDEFLKYLRATNMTGTVLGKRTGRSFYAKQKVSVGISSFKEKYTLSRAAKENFKNVTIGQMLSELTQEARSAWICDCQSLQHFTSTVLRSHDLLNRFFMDCIRIPLVLSGRERLLTFLPEESNEPWALTHVTIDFSKCYEPNPAREKHIEQEDPDNLENIFPPIFNW